MEIVFVLLIGALLVVVLAGTASTLYSVMDYFKQMRGRLRKGDRSEDRNRGSGG